MSQPRDELTRFLFERFSVRGHLVQLGAAWRALIEHHDYPAHVRDTLGEATAAAALLVATLKFEGLLTLQMQGDGPMHLMVAQCTHRHALRGVARWRGAVGSPDLGALLGQGQVTVTIEDEARTARYQGVVPVAGARISACLEEYFRRSEQLATRLWLVATPEHAAGLLLQRLPGAGAAEVQGDEGAEEDWRRVVMLAQTIEPHELVSLPAREILRRLFHEEDVRMFGATPVYFQCTCSRTRVSDILRSLGRAEVEGVLAEQGRVEVRCEFCNRAYRFDAVDAAALFAGPGTGPAPGQLQ